MTANAMANDRADALAAGMNDHIGKPFKLDELVRVILRYCHSHTPDSSSTAAPDQARSSSEMATGGWINADEALDRLGGQVALWRRLLNDALRPLGDEARGWREEQKRQDTASARRRMHTLKGVMSTMGATRLSALAQRLESFNANASDAAVEEAYRELIDTIAQTRAAWAQHPLHGPDASMAPPAATPTSALPSAAERTVLALIEQALEASDLQVFERVVALEGLNPDQPHRWHALRQATEQMDFDAALAECRRALNRICDLPI